MLWIVSVVLPVLWGLGLISPYTLGGYIPIRDTPHTGIGPNWPGRALGRVDRWQDASSSRLVAGGEFCPTRGCFLAVPALGGMH